MQEANGLPLHWGPRLCKEVQEGGGKDEREADTWGWRRQLTDRFHTRPKTYEVMPPPLGSRGSKAEVE
jgi:hypothetical protein